MNKIKHWILSLLLITLTIINFTTDGFSKFRPFSIHETYAQLLQDDLKEFSYEKVLASNGEVSFPALAITFPPKYLESAKAYEEGILKLLVTVFDCKSFPIKCKPIMFADSNERYGFHVYVDIVTDNTRLFIMPLYREEELIGILLTAEDLPKEKLFD